MAITRTNKTNGGQATDGTTLDTASISPTANTLIVAMIANVRSSGSPTLPTASGASMTWDQVATVTYKPITTPTHRVTMFRCMSASPGSGIVTFDFGGVTQNGFSWVIHEFGGVDTGGTNGSAAIVQSVTDRGDADPSPSITLASFGSATNAAWCGMVTEDGVGSWTAGSWPDASGGPTGSFPRMLWQFKASENTVCDATLDSQDWGGIAIEIKEATASVSAAIAGTATAGITEQDIRDGGKTITIELTGDTWIAA